MYAYIFVPAQILYYECVPILLSPHWLPPFSNLLDWSTFSARLDPKKLSTLKEFALSLDYPKLLHGVRAAKRALRYHLDRYTGDDMMPLLLYEMSQKVIPHK